MLSRRDLLKLAAGSGAAYAASGLPQLGAIAHASSLAPVSAPFLVNVTLDGGPDFRHLMPPAFQASTASFGYRYWEALASAHDLPAEPAAYQQRWENDYHATEFEGLAFGIHRQCGWFKDMWDAGNVAVICNVYGSSERNHRLAALVLDHGNLSSEFHHQFRSGWGGRLAAHTDSSVLALTRTPRRFCFGPHPSDPDNHEKSVMIAARDTREMNLFTPDADMFGPVVTIERSLRGYYAAKADETPASSVFRQFLDQERKLRSIGEPLNDRLANVPVPDAIARLSDSEAATLNDSYFALQVRNLYDCVAANDLLDMRVASLEYLNFDTHDHQNEELTANFTDLFGHNKALHSLYDSLPADARQNMVMVLAGEFGRQIR